MARVENLFVITSIVLLVGGISTPYLPMNTGWSIIVGKTSFGLAWETPLYGVAALFGMFACLYSIRYLPFNTRIMQWHFWLSLGCVIWCIIGGLSSIWWREGNRNSFGNNRPGVGHVFPGYDPHLRGDTGDVRLCLATGADQDAVAIMMDAAGGALRLTELLGSTSVAFCDGDVLVDGKLAKLLCLTAGLRPLHFQPVDLGPRAQGQAPCADRAMTNSFRRPPLFCCA